MWRLGLCLCLLLVEGSFCLSVSMIKRIPVPMSFEHHWGSGFTSPSGGFTMIDLHWWFPTDSSLLYIDTTAGATTNLTTTWQTYYYWPVLPFNSNKERVTLGQDVFVRLSNTAPPTLIARQPVSNPHQCGYLPLGSYGAGLLLYVRCAGSSISDDVIYMTPNATGLDWRSLEYFSGDNHWYIYDVGAVIDIEKKLIYSISNGDSYKMSLVSYSFDINSLQFNVTSTTPFILDGVPALTEPVWLRLVQKNTRVLMMYPALDGLEIGVILLDAATLKPISAIQIDKNRYQRFGAIAVGDDSVIFWSAPKEDVKILYTRFSVLQVLGDTITVGDGFDAFGYQDQVASYVADVDLNSPLDTVFVGLGSYTTSAIYQVKIT